MKVIVVMIEKIVNAVLIVGISLRMVIAFTYVGNSYERT